MMAILWRFWAPLLIAVIPAISVAEDALDVPVRVLEQFDVHNDGDALIVPVEAFGKTRLFILDTGCPGMVFDRRLRSFLGEPQKTITAPGLNEFTTIELFGAPKALVGSLQLNTTRPVACNDFSQFRRTSGHEIDGIVGMDFLRQFVIHIDFDSGKLVFLNASPQDAGVALPIRWINHVIPAVEVTIAGHGSETLVIDTGLVAPCIGSISPSLMKSLELEGLAKGSRSVSSIDASGKTNDVSLRYVKKLSVAGFDFNDARVNGHKLHQANILGLDFLSRFIATFDFPNGVIYLKKSKRFDAPAQQSLAGVELVWHDGRVIVQSVIPGSPASKVGIKPDDVVLRVGDLEVTRLRLYEIKQRFCLPGTLRLELRRGSQKIGADLQLSGGSVAADGKKTVR